MTERVDVRVASCNVKGGKSLRGLFAGGRRLGLAPADDRMRRACWRANRRNISVFGAQEASTLQINTVRRDLPRWNVVAATYNVKWRIRGRVTGSGNIICYRRDIWELLGTDEIMVPLERNVLSRYVIPNFLHFPVARLRHRESGRILVFIDFHFPAGRTKSANRAKQTCEQTVREYARKRAELEPNEAVVLVGDRNSAHLLTDLSHVSHIVDYVGSPNRQVNKLRVDHNYRGRVSDHASPSGVVTL